MSVLIQNIDRYPYTGTRKVNGFLRISNKDWINQFFNGTPDVEQVENVTRGKVYQVVSVKGYGDCEDITFIDDIGEYQTLADFFFEEV